MQKSESVKHIITALAKFHEEVKQPEKNATNPHFKSKYVDLDELIKVVNRTAVKHGLIYTQEVITTSEGSGVATTLWHTSGEYISFEPVVLPSGKNTAQAYGSSITYARRYSLSAALGLASDEDDDGNEATGGNQSNNNKSNQPRKASTSQKDQIAKGVKEFASLRDQPTDKVYSALYISDLQKITAEEANQAIATLNGWVSKAKEKGATA